MSRLFTVLRVKEATVLDGSRFTLDPAVEDVWWFSWMPAVEDDWWFSWMPAVEDDWWFPLRPAVAADDRKRLAACLDKIA